MEQFINYTVYSKEVMRDMIHYNSTKVSARYYALLVLGCAVLALSGYLIITGQYNNAAKAAVPGVLVVIKVLKNKNNYHKKIEIDFNSDEIKFKYVFYDDCFEINDGSCARLPYTSITKWDESENCYYMYLKKNFLCISKNTFILGNADDFSRFFREKMSRKTNKSSTKYRESEEYQDGPTIG